MDEKYPPDLTDKDATCEAMDRWLKWFSTSRLGRKCGSDILAKLTFAEQVFLFAICESIVDHHVAIRKTLNK